jgi:DNA polymerase-4
MKGRTITLKIKYHDFKLQTRSRSFADGLDDRETIYRTACELLEAAGLDNRKVRLLGISMSNFGSAAPPLPAEDQKDQLPLF